MKLIYIDTQDSLSKIGRPDSITETKKTTSREAESSSSKPAPQKNGEESKVRNYQPKQSDQTGKIRKIEKKEERTERERGI
jgi:hypothetical protein